MDTSIGRATLTVPGVLCDVAAATGSAEDGTWEDRVTPLTPSDAMNLQIVMETLPGPWELAYDGRSVWVNVEAANGTIYRLTEVGV